MDIKTELTASDWKELRKMEEIAEYNNRALLCRMQLDRVAEYGSPFPNTEVIIESNNFHGDMDLPLLNMIDFIIGTFL